MRDTTLEGISPLSLMLRDWVRLDYLLIMRTELVWHQVFSPVSILLSNCFTLSVKWLFPTLAQYVTVSFAYIVLISASISSCLLSGLLKPHIWQGDLLSCLQQGSSFSIKLTCKKRVKNSTQPFLGILTCWQRQSAAFFLPFLRSIYSIRYASNTTCVLPSGPVLQRLLWLTY